MPIIDTIISVTKGATAAVGFITILPIAGAATAASITGAIIGLAEHTSRDSR